MVAKNTIKNADLTDPSNTLPAGGSGDASTNTATSVDSEVALFSGTAGKTLKRATGSGLARLVSGVLSAVARTIDGQTFDGSANITVIAPGTHAASTKATPVDADEIPLVDSAASNVLARLTWANLKATLKTYFDSVTTTLTNKAITPRVLALVDSHTVDVNCDNYDIVVNTAIASGTVTINAPTGTPVAGQQLRYAFTGTNSRSLAWNAAFEASTYQAIPTTTSGTLRLDVPFIWNSASSKWHFDDSINVASVVLLTATQTLTGKTLNSPVVNTPTGIVKGDVGLGNVDNTSNATERAATRTLTNARITPRIGTTASSATPTVDADAHDQYNVTALAANATFGAPTGTPTDGQKVLRRIKDNGTARTLAHNAIYRAIGVTLPTTTVINKTLYMLDVYNAADTKWDVLAVGQEA